MCLSQANGGAVTAAVAGCLHQTRCLFPFSLPPIRPACFRCRFSFHVFPFHKSFHKVAEQFPSPSHLLLLSAITLVSCTSPSSFLYHNRQVSY